MIRRMLLPAGRGATSAVAASGSGRAGERARQESDRENREKRPSAPHLGIFEHVRRSHGSGPLPPFAEHNSGIDPP